jgi:hypothetical protein
MSNTTEVDARPGFAGVSVFEVLGVLLVLLALQFVYAASGFATGLSTILHRISYIIATTMACTWTMRLVEGFSLKYMGITVVLVAAGIVSIVALAGVDPLVVATAVVAVAAVVSVVVRFTDSLPNWTTVHTSLLFVVLGLTAMFIAAAPQDVGSLASIGFGVDVTPVVDGSATRVEVSRDGVISAVHAPLALVGAGLYVLGRTLE